MPIYRPSELNRFMESLGISPKKRLSQNFLLDGNIIRKILATAQVAKEDLVLEIGPGPGALTEQLVEAGARVLAVEKDEVLADALKRLPVEVYCQDILEFSIAEEVSKRLPEGKRGKVIANLPYHVTTPIIQQLVPLHRHFSHIVVMVQDEVARRFTAAPGSKEYGSITVFLNFYTRAKYAFKVSRNCFYPSPKVDSAIVLFELQKPPAVSSVEDFFRLTRTAFGQRRKMLTSTLKHLYPRNKIEEGLQHIGISSQARPEELSLDHFIRLFEFLT